MASSGGLIDIGTHRLFADCQGQGKPAVIFEAALGASSLSWALVQPEIARATFTCSYDRAGLGRSDAGPMPRSASRIVDELRRLLNRARIDPPFVLVGHSFGGMTARLFASRYSSDMAGLVLVDSPDPHDWANMTEENRHRLETGAWLARRGALAARLGIARLVAWLVRSGAAGAARRVSTSVSGGILRTQAEQLLAPLGKLPPKLRRIAPLAWLRPRFYEALASQMEYLPQSAQDIAAVRGLGAMPLAVLTATNPSPVRVVQQEEASRLSTRAHHVIAQNSGHWIPLDEPQLVIDAILDVIRLSKNSF